jgi:hypothetical protein
MSINELPDNGESNPLSKPVSNNNAGKANDNMRHWHRSSHYQNSGSRSTAPTHHKHKRSVETFVARHLLKITGGLFFIGGALWLILKSDSLEFIKQLIASFFSGGTDDEVIILANGNIAKALLHLLPGILILGFAYINQFILKGKQGLTLIAFYIGSGLLYITHLIEILNGSFIPGTLMYSSLPFAIAATLFITTSVLYFTSHVHKPKIHLASIIFIYLSNIILWQGYGVSTNSLFISIFIFSALLYFFSGKSSGSIVNTINAYFAIGYFGHYFLKKLLVQDHPELVWLYVGYESLFFLVFMVIRILKPYNGDSRVKKMFNDSIIYVVTAFCFITVWYVFRKYGLSHLQWVFAVLLTALNYALLRFNERISNQNRTPFYYAAIFVAATIVPLLVQENKIVLYAGMASLLLIAFAKYRKKQFAALLSVGMVSFALGLFLFKTVFFYFPAVYVATKSLPFQPFIINLIAGLVVTLAAYTANLLFVTIPFTYSPKWFSRRNIGRYIRMVFYAALYLSSYWLFQYLLSSAFNAPGAQLVSWYVFHGSFLLLLQLFVLNSKSKQYKLFLWLCIASVAVLPVINLIIIGLREQALSLGGASQGSYYFHFIGLLPLLALFGVTTSGMNTAYSDSKGWKTGILLFQVSFIVYLLLAGYDHITVIMGATKLTADDIIASNRLLPYTVVFYITSLLVMLLSFIKNIKLLRKLSLFLLLFTTLKVFAVDFSSFSSTGQALSFWLIGGFLFLYSFLYQRLRKG